MNIALGDRATDKITGFSGIVIGHCTYITGCDQVLLAPRSDGADLKSAHWFDIDRCEVVDRAVVPPASVSSVSSAERPGPDLEAPIK